MATSSGKSFCKELWLNPPVLKYFNQAEPVEIFCDASSNGLGAVLLQVNHPVAFSSRSLTDAETRYARIEKEMLSSVHACTKFHHYSSWSFLVSQLQCIMTTGHLRTFLRSTSCQHVLFRGCASAWNGMTWLSDMGRERIWSWQIHSQGPSSHTTLHSWKSWNVYPCWIM